MEPKNPKNILFIIRRPVDPALLALEALDMMLTTSAFDQVITVLFLNRGIEQLRSKVEQPSRISKQLVSLNLYDIHHIYVDKHELSLQGLSVEDLTLTVKALNTDELRLLVNSQDHIINA